MQFVMKYLQIQDNKLFLQDTEVCLNLDKNNGVEKYLFFAIDQMCQEVSVHFQKQPDNKHSYIPDQFEV